MASGCIPICSKIPSHLEIIKHNENGLVFELEEPKILNKIKNLNNNDNFTKSLARESIERVRKNNSIELLSSLMYEDYKLLNSNFFKIKSQHVSFHKRFALILDFLIF